MSTTRSPIPGVPDGATVSDDGYYWWDGSEWQLVPTDPAPAPVIDSTDVSRGDPLLGNVSEIAHVSRPGNVDRWAWAAAVAPAAVAAGFFFHPFAGLAAYAAVSVAAALFVMLDVKTLRNEGYVFDDFGRWDHLASLAIFPVAVPIYLRSRSVALGEDSSKFLTAIIAALVATTFAVVGLVVQHGSIFGQLTAPEEASDPAGIFGELVLIGEDGKPMTPEEIQEKLDQVEQSAQ